MSEPEDNLGTHRRPGEVEVPEWPSRWVGWILFAGVMMIVLGMIHAFQGFMALFDNTYFLVRTRSLAIHLDYTVWGCGRGAEHPGEHRVPRGVPDLVDDHDRHRRPGHLGPHRPRRRDARHARAQVRRRHTTVIAATSALHGIAT